MMVLVSVVSRRRWILSACFIAVAFRVWLQPNKLKIEQAHRPSEPHSKSTSLELAIIGAPWRLSNSTDSSSSQSLTFRSEYPTSFDILQDILKDNDVGNVTGVNVKELPPCLVTNHSRTDALVESVLQGTALISLPILNMGMPKVGSNTLLSFLQCAGFNANHAQCGPKMRSAASLGIGPVGSGCYGNHGGDAMLQMDKVSPPNNCFFPQIQLLDEIHQEHPNATFILNFRPVDDWIESVTNWNGLAARLTRCDLPGLPKGVGRKKKDLRNWYCGHVRHIREFVALYPSHALIELDLYDTERSARVMAKLFQVNETCWGHANKGKLTKIAEKQTP
jgi:hypothetical protein